jgi:hypothetical protein
MSVLVSLLGKGSVNSFPRQRIHAAAEELLDVSFPVRSVSYERRVCGSVPQCYDCTPVISWVPFYEIGAVL